METTIDLVAPTKKEEAKIPSPAPVKPAPETSASTKEETAPTFAPIKRTKEELIRELNDLNGDSELWYLTYMLHSPEIFRLKKQVKESVIPSRKTPCCSVNPPISRLEYWSRCHAESLNGYSYFSSSYTFAYANLKSKCKTCSENISFCPHFMADYIQFICDQNQLDPEEIYRSILGEGYLPKAEFASFRELEIPQEEYSFLDAVCVSAAAELLRLRFVALTAPVDDRISYSYLPICEKTKRSFLSPALEYYRCKSGKNDFIRLREAKEEITQNRNCPDCLFPQCPDKVAAYLLHLSDRFGLDVMELAEFIIQKNKIGGITLRGNFRYYDNMRKLEEIPFTAESRTVLNHITRYVVNKFTASQVSVPLIPFHMVIHTKDEKLADDTVSTFKDFLRYYCYFGSDVTVNQKEYRFSENGLTGLLDCIRECENVTLLHVKEMALLSAVNQVGQSGDITLQINQLNNLINEKKDTLCVILSGEKAKLDTALNQFSDLYQGTLSYHLTIADMSAPQIVQSIMTELKNSYELEEGFREALEYYVLAKYGESTLKSKAFIQLMVQTIIFNHYNYQFHTDKKLLVKDIPLATNRRSDQEIWDELNRLTGLETVKSEIFSIQQLLKFQKKLQNIGMKNSGRPNMHMVFTGNPGTGKTTVARLIAEILYNVGFTKQNKLVEVSSKDLIGKYIGHTAPKTAAVCESAYGGVLFIDEAYELAVKDGNTGTFRSECIAELIKQMEDNRDRLIVIFAGYTKEMQELMDSNAGFASRIGRIIDFEDYSTDQLCDMFHRLVYKNGMRLSEEAKDAVRDAISTARQMPNFGNGRYVRNLYEKSIMEHAKNTIETEDADLLMELQQEDIPSR